MIWVVILLCVLCIAMSCVALWYRGKWKDAERKRDNCVEENYRLQAMVDFWRKSWHYRGETIEELCDEVEQLRSQLPKRDSKGRFCKK